ncbi:hypothetical protein VTL71DRAFT_5445 [Oculimacula yallundae]|uniref:BTB domain-containing protein n=1 Tax=Oculimacula yallundae TaxID=86028 RepID=A0ABR4C1Q3_9HELO
MSHRAAKRQKLSPAQQSSGIPIIFTTGKHKADVRMFVFDSEYHVYSGVLKMNAAFFEAMLEPTGGIQPTSTSPLFKSDWHTTLDSDLGWVLSSDPSRKQEDLSGFKGDKTREEKAFQNVLSAIFSREYQISDIDELHRMATIADYYRALPILSYTVSHSVYGHRGFIDSIETDPLTLLLCSYKLRHKLLFREAFIRVLGPWTKPRYKALEKQHPKLFKLVHEAYKSVDNQISQLSRDMFVTSAFGKTRETGYREVHKIVRSTPNCRDENNNFLWPVFVQEAASSFKGKSYFTEHGSSSGLLNKLRKNASILNRKAKCGEGAFKDHFLCFQLTDAELPWDINEVDF